MTTVRFPPGATQRRRSRIADEGYLLGLLIGDGTLQEGQGRPFRLAGRSGRERRRIARGRAWRDDAAFDAASRMPHRSDFAGWVDVPGRGEYRMATGALKRLALESGMSPGNKWISPTLERRSSAFHAAFLRGFFDADGSVQGAQDKGVSVRLSQSDLGRLRAVQRNAPAIGDCEHPLSRPAAGRRKASCPMGKAGTNTYATAAQHELVISGDNLPGVRRARGLF